MCDAIAAPAAPWPETMLKTPGGKPAWRTSSAALAHCGYHVSIEAGAVRRMRGKKKGGTHGQRRLLAALQHDRTPRRERGRTLLGEEDQRRVPRDDDAGDAERLAERDVDEAGGVEARGALRIGGLGEVAEVVGGGVRVEEGGHGAAHRLRLELGELGAVRGEEVGEAREGGAALFGGERGPGREGGAGGGDGAVDVFRGGFGDCAGGGVSGGKRQREGAERARRGAYLWLGTRPSLASAGQTSWTPRGVGTGGGVRITACLVASFARRRSATDIPRH